MATHYSSAELRHIGTRIANRLPPASTSLAMFEYEMRCAAENESLFDNAMTQAAKAARLISNQQSRIDSLEHVVKACATHHTNEHTVSIPGSTHMLFTHSLARRSLNTDAITPFTYPPPCPISSTRAKLTSLVNSIVDGIKSFSPSDSDPKAVIKRTHWLANELDQESISTEDQVALTAVLGAIHVHETKMDLQRDVKHLRDNYLTVQSDLLDAQRRISKLEDNVRALTLQRVVTTDPPKLAQRIEVTTNDGQTLDLSVPKGTALVPLKPSSRAASPTPSSTNIVTLDDEKTAKTTEGHLRGTADASEQFADNEELSLHSAPEFKQPDTRYEQSVHQKDHVATTAASDNRDFEVKSETELGSKPYDSVQATASTDKKHQSDTFSGNDKPLPPVPAAHAFPQSVPNRVFWQHKQVTTSVDDAPQHAAQEKSFSLASPTWTVSSPGTSTAAFAKPDPSTAQTPQILSPMRSKVKATKWKDPPLFQETEPTPASTSPQFSMSPSFKASGQSNGAQKSPDQASQHPDIKLAPSKTLTPNENTRQLGSIVKVLQENKKLDEDGPLQKKPAKAPVFASADAMGGMTKNKTDYFGSSKPVAAAPSQTGAPLVPFGISDTIPSVASRAEATQAAVSRGQFGMPTASTSVASRAGGNQAIVFQVPFTIPTAGPFVTTRVNSFAPSSDASASQSSFLEIPQAPTKKRKSAVKLVKPETELSFAPGTSPSTAGSSIKHKESAKASLPGSSAGSKTPPGQTSPDTRDSTSPSTVMSSSPLTPAPIIKVTQHNSVMSAGVPAFRPSLSTAPRLASSNKPSPMKHSVIPDRLRSQMTPDMLALFAGKAKRS